MDLDGIFPNNSFPQLASISAPSFPDPHAPRREIDLSDDDESIVENSIAKLDKSSLDTDGLFEIFSDWQTKKTLTSKRVFLSTSLLVAAATWIGVDYTDLTLFGLKLASGNHEKLIIFVLLSIVSSGIFYEMSRRIDSSVRRAKISHINRDIKVLKESVKAIEDVMKRNNIPSFVDLYFDFRSSMTAASQHDAIDVFRAINFYNKNLSKAGSGLNIVIIVEEVLIYSIAAYAVIALLLSIL
ncbi:hypothetical protein GCM10011352_19390 [Marinobacterium zhoushanense]|uniref:SMODS and SLOG-associating 2TM effector domain-containing protein n=1 Tax=Marinobacterium zhoushanense TaxID=1679163 RepID=A0ABQ1KG79_9GAMM|nr:hypothetical protein [Marinobacterium zhoushanense]GGB93438.1 hypothetical protein GCM10011352_19390 [Marinobacterium zhoushanense]